MRRLAKNIMGGLFLLALALLGASDGAAAMAAGEASPFPADALAPVAIEADNFEIDQETMRATFSGNVRVKQGPLLLRAREVVLFYRGSGEGREEERSAGEVFQVPGTSMEITSIEAKGDVRISTRPSRMAEGKSASYDVAERRIKMDGGVLLRQDGNVLEGETLLIDLMAQTSVMESGEGGRVRSLFRPAANPLKR